MAVLVALEASAIDGIAIRLGLATRVVVGNSSQPRVRSTSFEQLLVALHVHFALVKEANPNKKRKRVG